MGNSISVENDLFVAQKGLCGKFLNNDHIAYITKQYITILKAKEILEKVTEQLNNDKTPDNIEQPCKLVFPLDVILADFISGKPLETSRSIFGDDVKQTTDHGTGKQVIVYNTVLNDYNHFFSVQYKEIKSDSDKVTRAKGIIKRLDVSAQIALSILAEGCNGIGTCGEQEQQAQKQKQ